MVAEKVAHSEVNKVCAIYYFTQSPETLALEASGGWGGGTSLIGCFAAARGIN